MIRIILTAVRRKEACVILLREATGKGWTYGDADADEPRAMSSIAPGNIV
jgi:hypothetical protein